MNRKIKVAYICVHNSCRSQMAEAISKLIAENDFHKQVRQFGVNSSRSINNGLRINSSLKINKPAFSLV